MTSTDVAVPGTTAVAAPGTRDLAELYREEMGVGGDIAGTSFDRVKHPAGGAISWEIPGANPEQPEVVQEIVGIVLDDHFQSSLWLKDEDDAENTPPDATWLEVEPGVVIAQINDDARNAGAQDDLSADPFNAWGSGRGGRGKAAKQTYRLYVLRDGAVMPVVFTVPPSSFKAWTDFKRYVLSTRKRLIPEVAVRMTLKRQENPDGKPYATIVFGIAEELQPDVAAEMVARREEIRPLTRRIPAAPTEDAAPAPAPAPAAAPFVPAPADDDIPV